MKVRKYAPIDGSNANNLLLVVLAYSKCSSLTLANYSTASRNGDTKKRRVGSGLVEFECDEAQAICCCGRNAVDDNINNGKVCSSFEDVLLPDDSRKR